MCGIMAYSGRRNGPTIVSEGLARLEYRGYDSWGIAARADHAVVCVKDIGKLGSVPAELLEEPSLSPAIGHVRWATHGGVSQANAHPHLSQDGRIAVVHNGIIENYQALRRELRAEGCVFQSETDTEVIPHLIARELRRTASLPEATRAALAQLEGSFAVAVVDRDSHMLLGARRFSPLVLGIGDDGCYLASDVPAFLAYTRTAVFLDENQMAVIEQAADGAPRYTVVDLTTGAPVAASTTRIEWDVEQAEKGGHPHFTIKEILEQPTVLDNVASTADEDLLRAAEMIRQARAVYIVACGTALHAGMYASYILSTNNGIAARPISAGEFPYFSGLLKPGDLMLTISQSGETADVMASVRTARKAGAKVLALVNVMGSSLMRAADVALLTKAGPEISVVSTKAYLSQLAMLTLLSFALNGVPSAGRRLLAGVRGELEEILTEESRERVRALAPMVARCPCIYAIGRGVDYPTALEWCLKIKEISYIHAEGFAAGDLKHGPLALVEPGIPVFALASDEDWALETLSNATEAKARGGTLIGVSCCENEVFDHFLPVRANGPYGAIPAIVYGQLLAYFVALEKGLDPDKPRNLAKSVTVK